MQLTIDQQVKGTIYGTLARILNRHDPIIALPLLNRLIDVRNIRQGSMSKSCSEILDCRLMSISCLRSEVSDNQFLLQGYGSGNDFPVNRTQGIGLHRPLAYCQKLLEYLLLSGRIVGGYAQFILNLADLDGCLHAIVKQAHDLLVNPIDFIPQGL